MTTLVTIMLNMQDNSGWTKEKIQTGFDRFFKENGRLPTAPEIDECDYLPSSRSIQRSFGGLRKLREDLGYEDTDFGVGKFRSALATKAGNSGLQAEVRLEKILTKLFGQVFVHTQRRYGDGKSRFDFVVYAKDVSFGVDVFSTSTTRDMQKNINLKMDRYGDFKNNSILYFVVSSNKLTSSDVRNSVRNMGKLVGRDNIFVVHEDEFIKDLGSYQRINNLSEVSEYFPYGEEQ